MDLFDLFAKISLDTSDYEKGLKTAKKSVEEYRSDVMKLAQTYKAQGMSMSDAMKRAYSEIDKSQYETAENAEKDSRKFFGSWDSDKMSAVASKFGNALKTIAKISAAAIGAAAAGVGTLMKSSIEGYGEFEQLVGGVETLFSNLEGTVSAAPEVLKNASNAYKTAGLSANQYMETVTSFSAALVSSLEGDYSKAAKISDMAITDMADNANKMGTSMDSIQAAYQGFAKQNYTMLDNLKLGYGGTKTEMERLLRDAEKFSGVKYDISNLSDVYEAIHVVQTEMGITGTTAKEAATTLQGSTATMKAAWQNLVVGFADENADLGKLIDDVVQSAGTMFSNLVPIATRALKGIGKAIKQIAPIITKELPGLVNDVLPDLLSAATDLVNGLVGALPSILQILIDQAPIVINSIIETVLSLLPQILDLGMQIILALADGLTQNLPTLIPMAVDIILQIVDSLISNVDLLVESAIAIIMALADGVINAVPRLLEKAPIIVEKLVSAIITNAPKLLSAGLELVVKLATGIADNFATILEKGRELVGKIGDGIKEKLSNLVQKGKDIVNSVKSGIQSVISQAVTWGKDLIQNFINGITAKFNALKDKVKSVASTVKKFLGFSVPEEGPLSDADTYMPDFMDLMAKGIRQYQGKVFNAAETLADGIETHAAPDFSMRGVSGYSTGSDSRILAALGIYFPELIDVIRNMKLYLDGRALVGGIIDYTDEGLGRISVHRERAN